MKIISDFPMINPILYFNIWYTRPISDSFHFDFTSEAITAQKLRLKAQKLRSKSSKVDFPMIHPIFFHIRPVSVSLHYDFDLIVYCRGQKVHLP